MESMMHERLAEVYSGQSVNIAVKSRKNQFCMSDLFEFFSLEDSFREINFRGAPLLGVAQEHNFHRPVSMLQAVYLAASFN
jgi:hypothetical protein